MQEIPILTELLLILVVTAPIVFIAQKLKLPAIIGFLIAGILLGPSVSGLVSNRLHIEAFAEIGVVLLLFTIGLEFSFSNIKQLRKQMLLGGSLQMVLTFGVVYLITSYLGWKPKEALIFGFLISLSSTAIVFKILLDRGEIRSHHGVISAGILLFQDFCVVPMLLVLEFMGEQNRVSVTDAAYQVGQASVFVICLWYLLKFLLPIAFKQIARLKNRELSSLFIILVVIGIAWITEKIGLSYALGAFIAGLLIAETDYCHDVMAEINPIRNVLFSLFFISIGMLLDVPFLLQNWLYVAGFTFVAVVGKGLLIALVVYLLTRSVRLAILVGLILAQVGEFSFILAQTAQEYELLNYKDYQGFLSVTMLSMIIAPFFIKYAPSLSLWFEESKPLKMETLKEKKIFLEAGHTIIIGAGMTGLTLARVLTETNIPFVMIDLDPDPIKEAKNLNYQTILGDALKREILDQAQMSQARLLVISIFDPVATRYILSVANSMNKELTTIVRSRNIQEIDELYKYGATQVISEEFETSVEIFSRVLEEYRVPRNITQLQVALVRQDRYGMLRGLSLSAETMANLPDLLAKTIVETTVVLEGYPCVEKTLGELKLTKSTGVILISIVRSGSAVPALKPSFKLQTGDVLILLGSHAQLDAVQSILLPEDRKG